MKVLFLALVAILSLVVNLNEACSKASSRARTNPTTPPRRPTRLFPFRIYGYIKKGKTVRVSCASLPGMCLSECNNTQYIIGKYSCSGVTMCCVDRSFVPKPHTAKLNKNTEGSTNSTEVPTNSSLLKVTVSVPTATNTRPRTVTTKNGVPSIVPKQKLSSATRPFNIFGFIPAQTKSTKTCNGDFGGVCRGECKSYEFVEGRYDCKRPRYCCVKRR